MFGMFLTAVAFFHLSEFFLVFLFTRQELSHRSFLISRSYLLAMSAAIVEYFIEAWLFPSLKTFRPFPVLGLSLLVLGEVIRKVAFFTARHNFTHDIKRRRRPNHVLVTHGVYG
eukprot:TRINITY_DN2547_c0_g1_i3.p1 TRINITY_DN2547_c0_g1~~TRINITY_DN2547_c0_g1_i3.p1  ORF type:complete len:114 (+),score=10.16 TRINITY_DN2547_c0_g1_i3:505-846(+)